MMKTKKSTKSLALVLAAVLALTPMAGFPITALATGEAAAPQTEAPAADATDAPATDAGETPQPEAPNTDADANTNAAPGTTPNTPALETPQAETPATDAATSPDTAGSATNPSAANVATPDLAPTPAPLAATPTADLDAATGVAIDATNFPDDIFRAFVQQNFDKVKDGSLDTDEIKAVTKLGLYGKSMMTLQGIEYFTALSELYCGNNQLTTLDVSANTALTYLDCCYNQLTSLDVSANTALTELRCYNNQLTTLDLTHNPKLHRLHCSSNQLTALDLPASTALTTLFCDNNQLTTLDVSANTGLQYLYCYNNKLTTLDTSHNPYLTGLNFSQNNLTTFDLKNLTGLCDSDLSPQRSDVVIPVIKRDAAYEVDAAAFLGRPNAAVDGQFLDTDGKVELSTLPNAATYTFDAELPSQIPSWISKTVTVEATNFAYSYLVTLGAGRNGTLTFDGTPSASGEILLAENSTPTFTVTPASGYQVATLTVNGKDAKEDLVAKDATSQTLTLLPVTDTVAIAVTFEKIPAVDITASVEGYGTIDPVGVVEVIKGTDKTFTITPKTGSELASVLVDGVDVTSELKGNTYTFKNVTEAHTIAATFKKIPPTPIVNFYSVTATAENGTITSDHATPVREGSSVKCAFSPKEGYALESVSVNGELVKATEEGTTTAKTYSYNINSIYSNTTIHVIFKAVEPPVDPTDPVDPPKPPVDPVDPVDPPKPPVNPADPINPPTPPVVSDNGGNNSNNGGGTTIVEHINTVVVLAAPPAAAPETPATPAAKTEAAPAQVAADNATPQGQLENPALGAQAFDMQHSHIPLALLLLAVWLVGGFAVIRQRKHTHDAIEGTSY